MAETTIKKNQSAEIPTKSGNKYSYQYVDIAQIHEYLEQNNMAYYQFIKTIEGNDYIFTQKLILDTTSNAYVKDGEALQGCRIVDATLFGNDNPAQKQGSAITYARRYSLLMAFGLATEDDDAGSLTQPKSTKTTINTIDEAESYKITFGKYKGLTLGEIVKVDTQYCNWLYKNEKTDISIKKALKMLSSKNKEISTDEDIDPFDKHRFDGEP